MTSEPQHRTRDVFIGWDVNLKCCVQSSSALRSDVVAPAFHTNNKQSVRLRTGTSVCLTLPNLRRLPCQSRCVSISHTPHSQTMAAEDDPPAKRRKLNADLPKPNVTAEDQSQLHGIARPISPPPTGRKGLVVPKILPAPGWGFDGVVSKQSTAPTSPKPITKQNAHTERDGLKSERTKYVPAPVQLTRIEDLAPHQNVDAVGLKDILGDPLIKECWNFNYLHDINWVM
jgi:hypothetical protein